MKWADLFKTFSYAFEKDPLSKQQRKQELSGAGVTQPDAIPDIRSDGTGNFGGQGNLRLHDSNDFIDLSTVSNRQSRYKEYQRLRTVPEIEMVMNVMADETCISAHTKVATLLDGPVEMWRLVREEKYKNKEFLVYCWDYEKQDFTLGWAYDPRLVKVAPTVKVTLDDGTHFICTPDHRVLKKDNTWVHAGDLKRQDELMPFYRIKPKQELTGRHNCQFPRIFTTQDGWKHERQFIDDWRRGKKDPRMEKLNKACRLLAQGMTCRETAPLMGHEWGTIQSLIRSEGFSTTELKWLGTQEDRRRVMGVQKWQEIEVYDLSVREHENFCGESIVFHNCQRGENDHVFKIETKNEEIQKELEHLFFNRKMLNFDRRIWNDAKTLFIEGDRFIELVIDPENPKDGILNVQDLPADSMFRIETTKGRLVEFQQSKEGPDYQALTRASVAQATDADIQQTRALRLAPKQVIHLKIGDDRKTFYPYGVSLIEPARGPAHQLRLMEDAMVVYRLTRAPERRVFYIDVGQLPPYKAEAFMERMKDVFRKKKSATRNGNGASAVEERWHAPAADEDYWLPIRPNSNTRIETLPGACLSLDTEIPLSDGRVLTLAEAIEEWNKGTTLWTYSCCPLTGKLARGLITWAGVTRRNTEVVRVSFDNGKSIVCTPDHKFPVKGKGKVRAENLSSGDSLWAFDIDKDEPKKPKTHQVTSVEKLSETIDTGTLTIDGDHLFHDYHTFAVSGCDVYTCNSNLGEIDDAVYFRNKLFTALNFPKNYFSTEDAQTTRIALSAQDVKFARMIERLQTHIEDGLLEIAERHLELRGYPEEAYEDLKIKMTPPSDWREMSRAEVVTNRINNAGSLKGSMLYSDYDILTRVMKFSEDDAKEMISRNKLQKLEEMKLQIIAQNPQLLGVGVPGAGEPEVGTEPGGPSPMLAPDGQQAQAPPGGDQAPSPDEGQTGGHQGVPLPDPTHDELKKYDLQIQTYSKEMDHEEVDYSQGD